jgi:hypothetical protein
LAGYEAKEDTCDGEKASRGDQVHEGFEDELFLAMGLRVWFSEENCST